MKLSELLASRLPPKDKPILEPTASPEEETETQASESLLYVGDNFEPPNPELFFASLVPLLLYPYSIDISVGREYRTWLLSPATYVLNSFPQLFIEPIFDIFMRENPPKKTFDLYSLWLLLSDLKLFVPASYQDKIEKLLTEKKF